jgi:hypothetical protein
MVTYRHQFVVSATFINVANTLRYTELSRLFYVEESSKVADTYPQQRLSFARFSYTYAAFPLYLYPLNALLIEFKVYLGSIDPIFVPLSTFIQDL